MSPEADHQELVSSYKRQPLVLALSTALPEPNTYKALHVVGVPVLLTRAADRHVRAFLNICSHQAAQICEVGEGEARRFVCPNHNWVYDPKGSLIARPGSRSLDPSSARSALTPLWCGEQAGLVVACLTPGITHNLDECLSEVAQELHSLELEAVHTTEQRTLRGVAQQEAADGEINILNINIAAQADGSSHIRYFFAGETAAANTVFETVARR